MPENAGIASRPVSAYEFDQRSQGPQALVLLLKPIGVSSLLPDLTTY